MTQDRETADTRTVSDTLVERLREYHVSNGWEERPSPLHDEAADRIDQLERERDNWRDEALHNRTYREQVNLACDQRNASEARADKAERELSALQAPHTREPNKLVEVLREHGKLWGVTSETPADRLYGIETRMARDCCLAADQLSALQAQPSCREALAELVRLKKLKDAMEAMDESSPFGHAPLGQMQAEYQRCKPLAWEAAIKALSALQSDGSNARRKALEEARRQLQLHDEEYGHITPKSTYELIDVALTAPPETK